MKAGRYCVVCTFALLTVGISESSIAQSSEHWELLWRNKAPAGNPSHSNAWMIPEASYTNMAYDKWRDVLYIVNPVRGGTAPNFTAEPRIHIWKAADGLPATDVGRSAFGAKAGSGGELPVPLDTIANSSAGYGNRGLFMNRYCLYNIDLDDEGRIFACNLVSPLWGLCVLLPSGKCDPEFLEQGPFRAWRWDTPASSPRLVYATLNDSATAIGHIQNSEQTYTSWGDAFDVIGKRSVFTPPNQGTPYMVDSARIYVGGGSWPSQPEWNREIHVLLEDPRDSTLRAAADCGNYTLDYRLAVKLVNGSSALASHGVAGTVNSLVHDVWMNCNPRLVSVDRHVQTANDPWPQTYNQPVTGDHQLSTNLSGPSGPIRYFELPQYGRKFIVVADGMPFDLNPVYPNTNTTARVIDVTTKGSEFILWEKTPQVGDTLFANTNAEKNYITDVDFKLEYMTPQENPTAPGLHITLFVLMSNNGIAAFRSKAVFPVELSTLHAGVSATTVDLSWDVTLETNNHGFDIERSFDYGMNWERIGFVAGRGTTTMPMTYRYADPVTPIHSSVRWVKYRLRQIDHDGTYTYSPVVEALIAPKAQSIVLEQNYPNPFNPVTTIRYHLQEAGSVSLRVYNTLSECIMTLVDDEQLSGTHQVSLSAAGLPSGTYLYQLRANGESAQKHLTVVK